jgi:hypothetical protein
MCEGRGGTDSDAAEVEVTPEMIEAGCASFLMEYDDDPSGETSLESLRAAIPLVYRAMVLARRTIDSEAARP